MDLNQQVAIANAVMRIICGDSRSYYVGRPVEEMNPLIKATFDWGGKARVVSRTDSAVFR